MFKDIEIEPQTKLKEVETALISASELPYNNVTHIYDAAGIDPDPKFKKLGGSCLHKLHSLAQNLPQEARENVKVIMSNVKNGSTTHYALTTEVDGETYYLDPFLWQSELMKVDSQPGSEIETLEDMWKLRREEDNPGSFLTVSLVEGEEKTLITHEFVAQFDALPNPAALPLKPDLPSFIMQIPDKENQKFYKVWYSKSGHFSDIWTYNGKTGERARVTERPVDKAEREIIFGEIERLLGCTEEELSQFFDRAHELEIALKEQMSGSSHDFPGGQHETI